VSGERAGFTFDVGLSMGDANSFPPNRTGHAANALAGGKRRHRAPAGEVSERFNGRCHAYPERGEAMARAFATGVYTMQELAAFFGVHYRP
jgi:hypothetical protein